MDVIIIIGAVQAFVFFLLTVNKKKAGFADQVLKFWFAIMALHLGVIYLLTPEFLNLFPHFIGINVGFPLLYGPFLLFYVKGLIYNQTKIKASDWLHFLPFIISYIILIPFYNQSAEEKLDIINGITNYRNKHLFVLAIQIISSPVYIIWTLFLLKSHRKSIDDRFSFREEAELKWLNLLAIGLLTVFGIVLCSNLIFETTDIQLPINQKHIIYTAVAIFIFVIGFKGLRHGIIYTQNELPIKIKDPEKKSVSLSETEVEIILSKMKSYMENEKPYLEEKLMLADIAKFLDIPSYKLTRVINDHLNQSFFTYINTYRIEAFKQKVADSKNDAYTLMGIAYDCGFASKASFNRIFRQLTGQTPTEFKKELSNSQS